MEKYIGCIVFCALSFIVLTTIAHKISIMLNLKLYRKGCSNLDTYILSLIVFTSIATLPILLIVYVVNILPQVTIVTSGLILVLSTALIGWMVQWVYIKVSKLLHLYPMEVEVKWTFILLCIGLSILCFSQNGNLYACIFLSSAIGRLFWLDTSTTTLKAEFDSLKELPATYLYSVAFIIQCIISAIQYSDNGLEMCCSIIGLFIGVFFVLLYVSKKS